MDIKPDYTLIIQLVVVLSLMVALSNILFKPFIRVSMERRDWIEGADRKARELKERTEKVIEQYRRAMASAQAEGAGIREEIRKASLAKEMEILKKAMDEANGFLGEMRGRIDEESRAARERLRVNSQSLSREIVERILGRAIQ
ncbi:MAG TPA: ATP synthase F0 subunit B [Thermodesulfobacteriota bacterium]|nr:ATP synthase F0 subunit B [Thermodesulfobacteriota bacterium]